MAITYTPKRLPMSPVTVSGTEKNETSADLEISYTVQVTDPGNPSFDPRDIDETDVYNESSLPKVNRTVYTTTGGRIIPFMVCRSVNCKRDEERFEMFHASAKFKNLPLSGFGQGGAAPQDPPEAIDDITPQIKVTFGGVERVLYIDKSETPKPILTPTRNFYAEPAIEKIPTQILQISQYEPASLTYDTLLTRKFKVNDTSFQGDARFDWLITEVEGAPVTVTLQGGPTNAALVTYTIVQSPFLYGWKDDRALVDTHYYDAAGRKIAFADESMGALSVGFVSVTGARKPANTIIPDRDQFETFDDIDFESFLHPSLFA